MRLCSILITWLTESLVTTSQSMRSRGSTLRGRTAFSLYRFDNRDRTLVVVIFTCLTVLLMAFLLDQTAVLFDPAVIITPITPLSCLFCAVYAVYCLLPALLQTVYERRFARLRRQNCQ